MTTEKWVEPTLCTGTGYCTGCGKIRGSGEIYGGVPCECGYVPTPLTFQKPLTAGIGHCKKCGTEIGSGLAAGTEHGGCHHCKNK